MMRRVAGVSKQSVRVSPSNYWIATPVVIPIVEN